MRPPVAIDSSGPHSGDERRFLQKRLALFCAAMFACFTLLVVIINVIYAAYPQTRPAAAGLVNSFSVAGLGLFAAAWWVLRGPRLRSWALLRGLDLCAVLATSAALAVTAVLSDDRDANVYSAFIWTSFAVLARSHVVPSSGRRTMWVSLAGMGPISLSALFVDVAGTPPPALFFGASVFGLIVVAMSTTGSAAIYGLRAQIRRAERLGQYTIEAKIGEGGMGAVYRARHAMLRRPTAVKLLHPERNTPEASARFEREVQATSELSHPNVVEIYDYGRSPGGQFYYAMELLEGYDLGTLVERAGPQPAARVVHILRQVCGALREAHGRGLTHRDIKPNNIILCERGGIPDVAKVVDFGLVKQTNADPGASHSGIIRGTPLFLSPEAIEEPKSVGPASDIYSLGAVGFFLLTGEYLFDGGSVVEICMKQLTTPPPAPSERTEEPIPVDLDALILRCLAKAPDDRPTASELVDALAQIPQGWQWREATARDWWRQFEQARALSQTSSSRPPSMPILSVDLGPRLDKNADAPQEVAGG